MKKKLLCLLPALLLLLMIVGFWGYYHYDSTVRAYQLQAHIATPETQENWIPGAPLDISFSVENDSYIPLLIREVIVLSAYDSSGHPFPLAGPTAASLSGSDTYYTGVQQHQAVFVTEKTLSPGITSPLDLFFSGSSGDSAHASQCQLHTETLADQGLSLQADIFLIGKPQAYIYSQWEVLDHTVLATTNTKPAAVTLPVFSAPKGYCWELERNIARLTGIGSITEDTIFLPASICLSQHDGTLIEDPIFGTRYDVQIAGNAFHKCNSIRTVSFDENAVIEDNTMRRGITGIFEGCTQLKEVHNIPSSVLYMDAAFRGCTAMEVTPELPEFVVSMEYCFYNCSSLTGVSNLPEQTKDLSHCFQNCASLTTVPVIPDSVEDMDSCFRQCTALETAPELSSKVSSLAGCFAGCSGLKTAPVLPENVEDLTECFMDCVSLQEVPTLPQNISYITNCFKNCTSMSGTVQMPTKIINKYTTTPIEDAFLNCHNLESVSFACCEKINISSLASVAGIDQEQKAHYTFAHVKNGICEGCHTANGTFEASGLTIFADDVPEALFLPYLSFVTTQVPDDLKETCQTLTITPDLGKYNKKYGTPQYGGYAMAPYGTAYVKCDIDYWLNYNPRFDRVLEIDYMHQVTYHELGHCYDSSFSLNFRHSSSSRWQKLHEEESSFFGKFTCYPPEDHQKESFACAVSCYFVFPDTLMEKCPGMYAYLDEIFGQTAAA